MTSRVHWKDDPALVNGLLFSFFLFLRSCFTLQPSSKITCKKSQIPGELTNNDSQFLSGSLDASVQAYNSQAFPCIRSQAG